MCAFTTLSRARSKANKAAGIGGSLFLGRLCGDLGDLPKTFEVKEESSSSSSEDNKADTRLVVALGKMDISFVTDDSITMAGFEIEWRPLNEGCYLNLLNLVSDA